jgi:hypothetical protein
MATSIKQRRKLSDLYKQGVEVRFEIDPETGKPVGKIGPFENSEGKYKPAEDDTISLYVRPPSPLQREMALRDGQAARARALINAKRNQDSEEYLTIIAFLADMSDETLVDYLLVNDIQERQQDAMRDVLSRDEWKDMTDYQDAMRQFGEMSEEELEGNEEYAAMLELDKKFSDEVSVRLAELTDAQRDALRMMNRDTLEKRALDKRSEMVGSQAFINEYELQMLFYSVRDPENHALLFFDSAREFAEQHEDFRVVIEEALMPFITEGGDAKN